MIELTLDEHKILVDALHNSATVVHKGLSLTDIPLYTKPQWQGLTDEERAEIAKSDPYRPTEMMKLAEAKLKEKNT
jgi:hypothetical protein